MATQPTITTTAKDKTMATMAQVFAFFKVDGYGLAAFRKDWAALSDAEKAFFKTEVGKTL